MLVTEQKGKEEVHKKMVDFIVEFMPIINTGCLAGDLFTNEDVGGVPYLMSLRETFNIHTFNIDDIKSYLKQAEVLGSGMEEIKGRVNVLKKRRAEIMKEKEQLFAKRSAMDRDYITLDNKFLALDNEHLAMDTEVLGLKEQYKGLKSKKQKLGA